MVHSYALRPAWTPLTIALMVIGFIVFWPLGLVMLAYIIWGHRVPELRRHFDGMKSDFRSEFRGRSWGCGSVARAASRGAATSPSTTTASAS